MKFFDREYEIKRLREIREQSHHTAQFTILTGRRRVGKTSLLMKAYADEPFLYFFVSRSSELELCREFAEELEAKLQIPLLGQPESFAKLFSYIVELSKSRPLTLVLDEFQEFQRVNESIFSQMQKIWDLNKEQARMNLVVCGSVYSLMNRLFLDSKEPLYGRQTEYFKIEPFTPSTLKEILKSYNAQYTSEDLLALFVLTGGVAKYVELLMDSGATTYRKMLGKVVSKNSFFIYEGKNMLIEEFGRDYGRYFDILKLIAEGHTSRGDIEGILNMEIAGYITRLENDYGLIEKSRPMFQKSTGKNVRYTIGDCFLRFWFRFIYKYNSVIEANAYERLAAIVSRDYPTYSGKMLERYFKAQMMERGTYTHIASWWDRKGENEIDIIAADELSRTLEFYEVKRQAKDIDLNVLKEKALHFLQATGQCAGYAITHHPLSLDDM